jgi:hypothetical protein
MDKIGDLLQPFNNRVETLTLLRAAEGPAITRIRECIIFKVSRSPGGSLVAKLELPGFEPSGPWAAVLEFNFTVGGGSFGQAV